MELNVKAKDGMYLAKQDYYEGHLKLVEGLSDGQRAGFDKLTKAYDTKMEVILNELSKDQRAAIGFPIKPIKHLTEFDANGNRYVIHKSMTIERFEVFEKIQVEVGYGVDFRDLFANLKKAYDHLEESRVASASVALYNIMHGVSQNINDRENPVLIMCSLFMCKDGEDLTTWSESLANDKINDWKKEGISMEHLFTFAFNLVNGFMPVYNQVSANISDHLRKIKNEAKK